MPTLRGKRASAKRAVRKVVASRAPVRAMIARAPRAPRAMAAAASAPSRFQSVGQTLGGMAGGLVGGPGGAALGRVLGGGAASLLKSIAGVGDYTVSSNTLVNSPARASMDSLPSFGNMSQGMRIRHREYIQDIVSSSVAGAFSITKLALQPAFTFPWLSNVAQQFQQYRIHGMVVEYKSTSSDALNSTNTALGTVGIGTQYDVAVPSPVNKQQVDQLQFTTSCKPSLSMIHPIECARNESPVVVLSTRNGPQATNTDIRLYDFANTYVYTTGVQGTSVNLGELWISYDVELIKPQLGASADQADHYSSNGSGVTAGTYFGTVIPSASATSDLGTTLTNTTVTFPSSFTGNVLILYTITGNANTATTSPTWTPSAGAAVLNGLLASADYKFSSGGTTWTNYMQELTFSCVGGGVLTLSGGTLPSSPTALNLLITVLPSSLTN